MARKTDVAVIGTGPGGYVAAIRLGQLGKKVIVVDKDKIGGTCLNYGCIPSKALITAAKFYDKIQKDANKMGINVSNATVDMQKMLQWKNDIVSKLTKGVSQLLKHYGHEVIHGAASFKDLKTVTVNSQEGSPIDITSDHFIVATGSVPVSLPFLPFDGSNVLSSKDILELNKIPEHLVVIGGGIIGLELGTVFAKLGSKLTIIELMDTLLPGIDTDLSKIIERKLKKLGTSIFCASKVENASFKNNSVELHISNREGSQAITADKVLVAVGVKPVLEKLNLQATGVRLTERGFVLVNEHMQTSIPHIYAIGDIAGPPFLAHKASKEGEIAAESISGMPSAFDCQGMPGAIFTDPEIATVGLTETEARKKGYNVTVGKFPLAANGRALTTGENDGLVKVIVDSKTKQLLGVHIAAPEASDMISEAALAIEMAASVTDIALTVHPHPTLSEMIMEAAKNAIGEAIHIINEKKQSHQQEKCNV